MRDAYRVQLPNLDRVESIGVWGVPLARGAAKEQLVRRRSCFRDKLPPPSPGSAGM